MTTLEMPRIRRGGSVRPGSRVSPPVNVTLFHADWENNGPIIASPARAASAVPPSTGRSGKAGSRDPSHWPRGSTTRCPGRTLALLPSHSPTTIRPRDAAVLVKVNEFWIHLPSFRPLMLTAVKSTIRTRQRAAGSRGSTAKPPRSDRAHEITFGRSPGKKTPRNLAKATATAAIVPV